MDLICSKYLLDKKERNLIYRATHSENEIMIVEAMRARREEIMNKVLYIDLINVSTTLNSLFYSVAIMSNDNVIRDFNGEPSTNREMLNLIIRAVQLLKPMDVVFVIDKNFKWSKKISLEISFMSYKVKLESSADGFLKRVQGIIATSDTNIIMRNRFIDLPYFTCLMYSGCQLVFFPTLDIITI